jgi:hypothetical protein
MIQLVLSVSDPRMDSENWIAFDDFNIRQIFDDSDCHQMSENVDLQTEPTTGKLSSSFD